MNKMEVQKNTLINIKISNGSLNLYKIKNYYLGF